MRKLCGNLARGGVLLVVLISGCTSEPAGPPMARRLWDTTLIVDSVTITNDSLLARSVVESGNDYRLARFFRKCESLSTVSLGFIGGSITQGSSATDSRHTYHGRLAGFLSKSFTNTRFPVINAGIGATNSRFGSSRVEVDLLASRPDLIVLEFAVNDDMYDTAWFAHTLEGLVRRCLAYSPEVPVIIFQTMNRFGDSLTHKVQERIARHYRLPVIGYRSALWPLLAEGRLAWESLSPDNVHPNDKGHLIGGYLLYDFLITGYRKPESSRDAPFTAPEPLFSDLYARAGILGPSDSAIGYIEKSDWNGAVDGKGRLGFTSESKGRSLLIRGAFREVTLQYRFAKDLHARAAVKVDGKTVDTLSNHFEADWGGGYLKGVRLYQEKIPRMVTLEVINVDGGLFDLRYLLFAP